jgi:hypothetical protein
VSSHQVERNIGQTHRTIHKISCVRKGRASDRTILYAQSYEEPSGAGGIFSIRSSQNESVKGAQNGAAGFGGPEVGRGKAHGTGREKACAGREGLWSVARYNRDMSRERDMVFELLRNCLGWRMVGVFCESGGRRDTSA